MSDTRSVELIAAHITRATQLVDQGDPLGDDLAASMRLADLSVRVWSLSPEPVTPDLTDQVVQAQGSAVDCLRTASALLAEVDLAELSPGAARFLRDLHDLAQR